MTDRSDGVAGPGGHGDHRGHLDHGGRVDLVQIQDGSLSVDAALDAVKDPRAGGVVVFVGVVRNHDQPSRPGESPEDRLVTGLEYSAHPAADAALREVAAATAARPGVVAVAVAHRVGALRVGDRAVVLAVSAGHRGEAFEAARYCIDELKERVPIWKHQLFDDGSDEWVGTP